MLSGGALLALAAGYGIRVSGRATGRVRPLYGRLLCSQPCRRPIVPRDAELDFLNKQVRISRNVGGGWWATALMTVLEDRLRDGGRRGQLVERAPDYDWRAGKAMITSDRTSRMLLSWALEGDDPVVAELVQNPGAEDAGRRSLKACGRPYSCLLSTLNGGRQ